MVQQSPRKGEFTAKDPLSFEVRKEMILKDYPKAKILPIYDQESDELWSETVDKIIEKNFPKISFKKIKLIGSRDSFIHSYSGKYITLNIPNKKEYSGTRKRKKIKDNSINSVDFRRGIIYANQHRFPVSYQTVDVAIFNKRQDKILLGRKKLSKYYHFIGGFVDPKDKSLEEAALREVMEEVGNIETSDFKYLISARIEDYRYLNQEDQIMTAFFQTIYYSGEILPGDDIVECRWFSVEEIEKYLISYHKKLIPFLTFKNKRQ